VAADSIGEESRNALESRSPPTGRSAFSREKYVFLAAELGLSCVVIIDARSGEAQYDIAVSKIRGDGARSYIIRHYVCPNRHPASTNPGSNTDANASSDANTGPDASEPAAEHRGTGQSAWKERCSGDPTIHSTVLRAATVSSADINAATSEAAINRVYEDASSLASSLSSSLLPLVSQRTPRTRRGWNSAARRLWL
jgi:hypothetical protein